MHLLWPKVHFEVKMLEHPKFRSLSDILLLFRVACARDCAPCQKSAKHGGFVAVSTSTTTPLHYLTLPYSPFHSTPLYPTPLHPNPPHSTPPPSTTNTIAPTTTQATATVTLITSHYTNHTRLDYTTLPYTRLRYISYNHKYKHNYTCTRNYNSITLRYAELQIQLQYQVVPHKAVAEVSK